MSTLRNLRKTQVKTHPAEEHQLVLNRRFSVCNAISNDYNGYNLDRGRRGLRDAVRERGE